MTDHTCALEGCDRPVPDTAYVCPRCGDRLIPLLNAVPGILDDLDDVIARQVRFTTGGTRSSDERPLPYNPAGSDSRHVLVSTLLVWAQLISEQRGIIPTSWDPAALGPWLAGHVDWMRAQAAGPEAMAELDAAVRQARRTTDRPADRQYAGPCTQEVELHGVVLGTCGTDLYTRPGRETVTCQHCGTEYPLRERRAWLLDQAEDTLLPAKEISRAVDGLGVPISLDTIKSWVRRKQLAAHGKTPAGVATYRVGDVLTLVREGARRRGTDISA